MARRSFGSRGHGSRRLTQWIGPALQEFVSVASTGATLIGSAPFDEASTVVRVRGQATIQPGSFAADLNVVGAIGIGVVSSEALGVGVSAIPEPFTDADWGGWLLWRAFSFHLDVQTAAGFDLNSALQLDLDSKAMRKVGPNESIVLIAESQTGAFDISMPVRMLVKLS